MRPLCDLCTLRERQTAIEYLSSPRNEEITSTLQDCIKHVKNIPVSDPYLTIIMYVISPLPSLAYSRAHDQGPCYCQ